MIFCVNAHAFAQMPGFDSWNEPYHIVGHEYVPRVGTFSEYIASGSRYVSKVYFWLDQTNVNVIIDYNNGVYNLPFLCSPGGGDDGYLTVDVIANPHDGNTERLNAYYIVTNLPNPVKDLEDDISSPGNYDEESEVAALGTVGANIQYYVKTYWNDYREINGTQSGVIGVNFGISHQSFPLGDYNNCFDGAPAAIVNDYSGQFGEL